MLRARIDEAGKWPAWFAAEESSCDIDWATLGEPILDCDSSAVDLRVEPGLKIWVRTAQGTTRLRLRFQHACCDGLGALNFVEDLLILYTQQVRSEKNGVRLIPLEAKKLQTRGEVGYLLGHDRPEHRMTFRDYRVTAVQWVRLLARRPVALTPTSVVESEPTGAEIGYATGVLEAEEIHGLRRAAVGSKVSVNDLMLSDLFQTLGDWNNFAGQSKKGWLRINVPVSLRTREDKSLPAANRLSFAFLSRRLSDCQDRKRLLDSVHTEMEIIRREHLSLGFLAGLAFVGGHRGLLPWFLERNRSFATIVMSNLGRPFARTSLPSREGRLVCGDVTLDEITGAAPIRPGTRASIAVIRYANRLLVNLKCDPQFFSPAETEKLLGEYMAKLRETSRRG